MTGILILIVGPSGSGKDTLLEHARSLETNIAYASSYTTREMRPGESQGEPYYFIAREDFEERIKNNEFLEWAEYADNLYGTARENVLSPLKKGGLVIKEVEVQGARILLDHIPRKDLFIIFISAPKDQLEQRIRGRGSLTEKEIQERKERFDDELAFAKQADVVIENMDGKLDESKKKLEEALEQARQQA